MLTILCTRRLQPLRDDCAVRVQWFSSVFSLSQGADQAVWMRRLVCAFVARKHEVSCLKLNIGPCLTTSHFRCHKIVSAYV